MRARAIAMMMMLGACGRIGFDGGELGIPRPLTELNSPELDNDPTVSPDELEIIFSSLRATTIADLYVATRSDRFQPFSEPVPISEINTAADEASPELSEDGLSMYFTRGGDIYRTTRAARGEPWTLPVLAADLSSTFPDRVGRLTANGLAIYTMRMMGGNFDFYVARRSAVDAVWEPGTLIAELATPADEVDPWVDPEELTMYFSRGVIAENTLDLYVFTRAGVSEPWGTPRPLDEINTAGSEADAWIPPIGDRFYFTQDVHGQRDIFVTAR